MLVLISRIMLALRSVVGTAPDLCIMHALRGSGGFLFRRSDIWG